MSALSASPGRLVPTRFRPLLNPLTALFVSGATAMLASIWLFYSAFALPLSVTLAPGAATRAGHRTPFADLGIGRGFLLGSTIVAALATVLVLAVGFVSWRGLRTGLRRGSPRARIGASIGVPILMVVVPGCLAVFAAQSGLSRIATTMHDTLPTPLVASSGVLGRTLLCLLWGLVLVQCVLWVGAAWRTATPPRRPRPETRGVRAWFLALGAVALACPPVFALLACVTTLGRDHGEYSAHLGFTVGLIVRGGMLMLLSAGLLVWLGALSARSHPQTRAAGTIVMLTAMLWGLTGLVSPVMSTLQETGGPDARAAILLRVIIPLVAGTCGLVLARRLPTDVSPRLPELSMGVPAHSSVSGERGTMEASWTTSG
ncbi:hypothetical protein M2390_002900 [Mycetocola sp. BIGb0189]|uniref:hypothetical protein n=1 Tax=Mycetocola sp. BIGb0189 TaxID=2940604 RepID=UPI002168CA72|nr:hypothetical protein [Mycetocola sp. BIGb0189]MCS4277691.1 hypothetical protein [Mycetocola sp. BIGb0189]